MVSRILLADSSYSDFAFWKLARLISYSCTEIACRERSRLLRSTCAEAVSYADFVAAYCNAMSLGSIAAMSCPFFTFCPSMTGSWMICPLTRKASFTYSTASTIPEKSFLIIDLDSTIVVFTGRAVVVVVSFFCPQPASKIAAARTNPNSFFIYHVDV